MYLKFEIGVLLDIGIIGLLQSKYFTSPQKIDCVVQVWVGTRHSPDQSITKNKPQVTLNPNKLKCYHPNKTQTRIAKYR